MTKQLRQLTPRETFLIGGETARVYQHTGGLILLDASDRPDFGFQAFRRSGVQATNGGAPGGGSLVPMKAARSMARVPAQLPRRPGRPAR